MKNSIIQNPIPEPVQPVSQIPVKTNNSLVLIMSVLLIISIAIASLFYFQIQKLSKELSKYQTQPTPLVSLAPSAEEETANWKTYTNDEYRIEIKYYPESTPYELVGNTETGQFTYLYQVNFGMNPLKSIYGYSLVIRQKQTIENYRTELIGHITDKIDSEEDTTINGNTWKKINYQMFLTTDYVPMTMAYINHSKYDFVVTASALDIDQILSTFEFLGQSDQKNQTGAQRVNCPTARPQMCTMECAQPPPYICGSDGKSYCSVCQACSDKNVAWYEMKASACTKEEIK